GAHSVNGLSWHLNKDTVNTCTIFSFVAPNEIISFNSDLKPFITYLTQNQGVSSSQLFVQPQSGTEPFTG
ncbi:hypothetical protein R3P38DRAFT_2417722, partial [Favolaschia claudopus]